MGNLIYGCSTQLYGSVFSNYDPVYFLNMFESTIPALPRPERNEIYLELLLECFTFLLPALVVFALD